MSSPKRYKPIISQTNLYMFTCSLCMGVYVCVCIFVGICEYYTHLFKCAFARFHRWGYVEQSWLHVTYPWVFWLILSPKAFRSPSFQRLHSGSSVVVFLGWLTSSSGPIAKFVFIFLLFVPALLKLRCHDSNCLSYFYIHVSLTEKKTEARKDLFGSPISAHHKGKTSTVAGYVVAEGRMQEVRTAGQAGTRGSALTFEGWIPVTYFCQLGFDS